MSRPMPEWKLGVAAFVAATGLFMLALAFQLNGMSAYEEAHGVHGLCHNHADGDPESLAQLEPARPADPPLDGMITLSHIHCHSERRPSTTTAAVPILGP